jgi:hypothetical protein
MVLGQFSDICGHIRKLAKDHKGYGSAARPSLSIIGISYSKLTNLLLYWIIFSTLPSITNSRKLAKDHKGYGSAASEGSQ